MKINFGKITDKYYLDSVKNGDNEAFNLEDNYYDFQLVVEEDQITIVDSIGRYVPMSFEDAMQLKQALQNISIPLSILREAQYQLDSLLSDVNIAVPV